MKFEFHPPAPERDKNYEPPRVFLRQLISQWSTFDIVDGKKVETCRNFYYRVNNSYMYTCEYLNHGIEQDN